MQKMVDAGKTRTHRALPMRDAPSRTQLTENPLRHDRSGDHLGAVRAGGPGAVLSLQRLAGNAAVAGMLGSGSQTPVQRSTGAAVTVQRTLRDRILDKLDEYSELNRRGYNQGRDMVGPRKVGQLLKVAGKSVFGAPLTTLKLSPRSATFYSAMARGLVARAALWAPEKFGWTEPHATEDRVNFGEAAPEAETDEDDVEEEQRARTIEELDANIRWYQGRSALNF